MNWIHGFGMVTGLIGMVSGLWTHDWRVALWAVCAVFWCLNSWINANA